MNTEIQQLLLSALTDLTKEYQRKNSEQIEREKLLINVLEKLQSDQIEREKTLISVLEKLQNDQNEQSETYQKVQKSYIESLRSIKQLEEHVLLLTEQNLELNSRLQQLFNLLKR